MLRPWDGVNPWGLGCPGGLLLPDQSTWTHPEAEEWAWGTAGFEGAAPLPPEPHQSKSGVEASSLRGGLRSWRLRWGNLGPDRYEHLGLILPDLSSVSLPLLLDKTSLMRYLQDLQNTHAKSLPRRSFVDPSKGL